MGVNVNWPSLFDCAESKPTILTNPIQGKRHRGTMSFTGLDIYTGYRTFILQSLWLSDDAQIPN
jgi:hypothetical protein